ncbi:MAG: NAD(P)-dependent glycerol-3-phosphate dehydrogenase [Planctomycetes bacterium]|jgi:glycerol-3-phosphate dehydrogenase (NAD(P)+)|nr:NAD(P)-dependent glycerol-3-phosphate dehydrogenase [Planctomycetota bacterium]MBT6451602.1 NAD(P)-dependent glycerol-3-phosphate dehydrogenase [Planctomycetota bacterium]MBT6540352.1 NAD(P)-dependent glycerol-3-phosphate dehydrogenase [Planctomycetota bacterium]MBT6784973.1 NAD(P)-dependent glycerol-3-phosphate dehydrogenase [Planctomycetota bacterium]MBT6967828.1 NAD(P)-dependent glycerol-3-phosphate dehydrogenase [Planctomycetota bacterium]
MKVVVAGSGSWGTALAHVARQGGAEVTIHCRRAERADQLARGFHDMLPQGALGEGFRVSVAGDGPPPTADLVICAVPTQQIRQYMAGPGAELPRDAIWVSASKGLELETNLLPSQVLQDCGVTIEPAVLSGPSHAEEVVANLPTAVVVADVDLERGKMIQQILRTPRFRIYRSDDRTGVEWAGALKNVVALGCGIAIGQGFGDNTVAALVTRGTVEISRLGTSLGGRRETFAGLSGIGDLVVTCCSGHSRNRTVGCRVGAGETVAAVLDSMEQVAEGVMTSKAVKQLCSTGQVEMPIADTVFRILHEDLPVAEGVEQLLMRQPEVE